MAAFKLRPARILPRLPDQCIAPDRRSQLARRAHLAVRLFRPAHPVPNRAPGRASGNVRSNKIQPEDGRPDQVGGSPSCGGGFFCRDESSLAATIARGRIIASPRESVGLQAVRARIAVVVERQRPTLRADNRGACPAHGTGLCRRCLITRQLFEGAVAVSPKPSNRWCETPVGARRLEHEGLTGSVRETGWYAWTRLERATAGPQ